MYQNRVFLMGFTGQTPEIHSGNHQNRCTVFSLATKSSYKDKKTGEYVKRTEWHRIVAWGKLGAYAVNIAKGSHVLVEGELRSTELVKDDTKKRFWEIRADSIRRLDRRKGTGSPSSNGDVGF